MTNKFFNHCLTPQVLSRQSRATRFVHYLVFLLFTVFGGSAFAQTTLTYNDGDLFLGFRSTDGTSDYLINIGQPDQFVNASPGSTFPVDVGNTTADLMTAFGSDWYTRIDPNTGVSAVFWAVTGGRQVAASGDPANTLYSTDPSANPWPRHSDGLQSFTTSLIATLASHFAGNQSTANNPHGLIQNAAGIGSYASFQPGGANSGGISFQTWNPWNEGVPAATLFFDRIAPGSGPSTVLGAFTLNSSGQVTFTAATGGSSPTPTATATATATGTPAPTPTATATATGTPAPSPSPTPSASPTPSGTPTTLGNISTRLRVETGTNVLIGGFIVTGTQPKRIITRAIGPSLPVAGALADPVLELHDSAGALIASNDNWRTDQETEIIATGVPPSNNLESAIVQTLPANGSSYTVIVRGANNGTGVGLVEVYDLDSTANSKLANISTRGLVQTGNDAMIAGTIVLGQAAERVLVRAIGPSLELDGKLADPTLELRDGNGTLIRANDNWRSDQEAEIIATAIPPTNNLESAIVATLPANGASYTAIVRGVNDTTGVALVEIYALN